MAVSPLAQDPTPQEAEREAWPRSTRTRLMLATERLVAEHGVAGVSVRDIAREAGTALSAVDYHFGSKVKLVLATLEWRGGEAMEVRRGKVAPFESQARIEDLRGLLYAILEVHVNRPTSHGGPTNLFFTRLLVDPTPEIAERFREAAAAFRVDVELIRRARPALSFADACWRYHVIMGITHLNRFDNERLVAVSGGQCDPSDPALMFDVMVDYAMAILMLPPRAGLGVSPEGFPAPPKSA